MRSVCRNVHRFPSSHNPFLSLKRGLHFTIEKNESFFEVVAMGRRSPPGGTCISIKQYRLSLSFPESSTV